MMKLSLSLMMAGLCSHFLAAQPFQRMESLAGLGDLSQNTGVAAADFDGDNDLDFYIVAKNDYQSYDSRTWSKLFQNNNDGTFTDVTAAAGLLAAFDFDEVDPGWDYGVKMGASWGDYDNDGHPDLLLTGYRHLLLYHNKGDGTFEELSQNQGFPVEDSCYYTSALWWDYDADGWLDLFVSKWGGCFTNRLYHNRGDGSFEERTNELGLRGNQGLTWSALPWDVNQDGRLDLYLANDFSPNELFIQQEDGTFIEGARGYDAAYTENEMGMAFGDYNRDGAFELYITNITNNRMLSLGADQRFNELSSSLGIRKGYWAWSTRFADLDLDGDEDLIVVNGDQNDENFFPDSKTNFIYENQYHQGQDTFLNIAQSTGLLENSNSLGLEVFDYDQDGDMDILIPNMDRGPFFYENKRIGEDDDHGYHWVKVELAGTLSNRDAFGAIVEIHCSDTAQYRYYHGAGFLNQSLQGVHFGLGGAAQIDSLIVRWPSGLREAWTNLPANHTIHVTEQQGYTLAQYESIKVKGCTDPASCTYNPAAVIDDGSCTYLPKQAISGPQQSTCLNLATYTCSGQSGSRYVWEVSNGKIIQGQGTQTIEVKWGLGPSGSISVMEFNGCQTRTPTELAVELNLDLQTDAYSVARLWNEALLEAIRKDFARPTVHARNLFHTSVAMYDAWAVFDETAQTYLLGRKNGTYLNSFYQYSPTEPIALARKKALSYAAFRLLSHRFKDSPGRTESLERFAWLMKEMGYDPRFTNQGYETGDAAALGNFIGNSLIEFGLQDGANEQGAYENQFYEPVNRFLTVNASGNPRLTDPNRWQPLGLETFIDQSGNLIPGRIPDFLSPEWGRVQPFALSQENLDVFQRGGHNYKLYHNPAPPPMLGDAGNAYRWGFGMVSIWGSHLDPGDSVMWDISPGGLGNAGTVETFPKAYADYPDFYDRNNGGDPGKGHPLNPYTDMPYAPNLVPRGDYTRVLAEFWADGPDSETPPGHWFVLLNEVSDHPVLQKKWQGEGEVLSALEWEVKSYLTLGGAMHDAAIAAWGAKGWYDYLRPISAIRYLAELGQSTYPDLPNYDSLGWPLEDRLVELVGEGDELAGAIGQHIGKVKLYTWRGHRYIRDPEVDQAGVGWILAEDWMPYQRPSFVTPPFAGFVSGHSTYSRAAAEVMTLITGDPYFPAGMGTFIAPKNEFLVFEEGPSQDVELQWATYRDASDQCSLSRIWGGIHPPADDLPGRIMGEKVGKAAYEFAQSYFQGELPPLKPREVLVFPNPAPKTGKLNVVGISSDERPVLYDQSGRSVYLHAAYLESRQCWQMNLGGLSGGLYLLRAGSHALKVWIQ